MRGNDEFENWARGQSMDLEYRNIPGMGQYYECPKTLLALESWVASRAALVIELPKVMECDDHWTGDIEVYDAAETREALTKAGVTVK